MPEGHTVRRLALRQQEQYGGHVVAAASPQGRFAIGAGLIDGHVLTRTDAVGKHLLHHYLDGPILHVHLGLYGKFVTGLGEPPEPRGALRLRLVGGGYWSDLRGPTACEIFTPADVDALFDRLGPDPLRPRADPLRAFARLARSRTSVAALLMDQAVIAGIGNVYRAELLFRHRVDPFLAGRLLPLDVWTAMWADLVTLMRAGVRSGRIETVRTPDRVRRNGRIVRSELSYVYRRAGLPCRVCGTIVRTEVLVGRNLFWCPNCQAPGSTGV